MKLLDRFLEAVAADKPHRVIRTAVIIRAQTVNRHDSGMLEAARDLGLDQKAVSAGRVVGAVVVDLLESDLAVELRVQCDENRAKPPLA